MLFFSLSLQLLCLVGFSSTLFQAVNARSHSEVQARHLRRGGSLVSSPSEQGNLTLNALEKRGDSRFSWYVTGQGACGQVNGPDDFIVAINTPQWDGGSHCFETITVNYHGKTAQAQIVDRCVECPYGALDFSHGLFAYLIGSPEQVGMIYDGDWEFGAGSPAPKPTTSHTPDPTPTPTPTPEPTPEPTTTSTRSTRTSTTTSADIPTSTSETTSSTESSSTETSSSAAPSSSPTAAPKEPELIQLLNTAMIQLGGVVMAGLTVQSE